MQRISVFRPGHHHVRPLHCGILLALLVAHGNALASYKEQTQDLTRASVEQLLQMEVSTPSRFSQKAGDTPSDVTVISARDIQTYGWRSLAEILRSVGNLYLSDDHNYSYLGARGFLRPGDYNSRFLLLIDGNRINDPLFDQALIGNEFILDVDLIERVEYVNGPGSSMYGANAFFGVINVITKHGADLKGPQVSAEIGSFGSRQAQFSVGWHDSRDTELLLSASSFTVDGQDLYFPEFNSPGNNHGVAQGRDGERGQRFFMKAASGPFSLTLAHSERSKDIPTASFGQAFNAPGAHTLDIQNFIDVGYHKSLAERVDLSARLFWGGTGYRGDYIYDLPPLSVNRDDFHARWWGGELRLVHARTERHTLVAGLELQQNTRIDMRNIDVTPATLLLDSHQSSARSGIYLQDEYRFQHNLLLSGGLRYDHHSATGGVFNPRLGLTYLITPATTLKTLYGSAYRAPNASEQYYDVPTAGGQKANPALKEEHTRSYSASIEQQLAGNSHIKAAVFRQRVSNLISETLDPADGLLIYKNMESVTARGLDLAFDRSWAGGLRGRASVSWQRTIDDATGAILKNSPQQLAKLLLSAPLPGHGWRAALETLYVGRRNTLQNQQTGGYWISNLTLFSDHLAPGMELSASAYNVFNRSYAGPAGPEFVQDTIAQDPRSLRLKLRYGF